MPFAAIMGLLPERKDPFMSTVRKSPGKPPNRSQQRRAALAAQAIRAERDVRRRRMFTWGAAVVTAAIATVVIVLPLYAGTDASAPVSGASPMVGGDLHTVLARDGALYVGGHARAAVSRDDGKTWQNVASLEGADPMGWAASGGDLLAGGHPGLYRSGNGGSTFEKLSGSAGVPDVHALGGAGRILYLASPQRGVMASTDGGKTWQPRNPRAGQSFMGTILVDPENTERLIAPDMAGALAISSDGGRTWQSFGGPMGAMAAAWNPTNTHEIIATGMQGAERSTDAGATWDQIQIPPGTSAVTYAPDGKTLYAAALNGERALVYRSTDIGKTWTPTA